MGRMVTASTTQEMQLDALNKTMRLLVEQDERFPYVPISNYKDSPLSPAAQRIRYLMHTGYADDARELAKALATEGLAEIGRHTCPYTGGVYFEDFERDE